MRKLLFLTQESPFPPRGSDKFRDFHLLRLLCEKMDEVELLCLSSNGVLVPKGFEFPPNLAVSEVKKRNEGLLSKVLHPFDSPLNLALQTRAEPGKLLWVSRLLMASCVPFARTLGYRVILDEHNVESALMKHWTSSPLKKIPRFIGAIATAYYESHVCLKSNAVVAASNIDASRLAKMAPGARLHVVPNAVDYVEYEMARAGRGETLFFSGSLDHPTNIAGLNWFLDEILPRLRARLGSKLPRIVAAGSNPDRGILSRLKTNGIEVHANPESMIPYFAEAAVVFVPIREGGGTPLKILEGMAAGRPVVSTGKATEGLVLAPSYDILIADTADGFASAILRLLENAELRRELGVHASQTVLNRYDWRRARGAIEDLLETVSESCR